ncbi:protein-methionine-sulfoxide reductase catalytic subunit MsrP [Helicobacter cappadocius]|uniref:Protein-methionine-sulfoxide reductase catalytic subunit MsrP n=1 Tax=Helicobacter cappadocius TaxID=3063998 RepID=A0AA90PS73_9HELI|nr:MULTISPECIES: protein-methionine-sulfoxide reductase catalytic subunit MsrP [unclassified Helicobacter]MDO7252632.1 protein-methionine-sulfoxide reductase catalytic subunit MsrP [Helicobacter sp. faydin-H75]MDP2538499.1 protein-methionine-sulfoxide reductase catalytic subunit MsrP [Helicobacter sp. faydin-H76]
MLLRIKKSYEIKENLVTSEDIYNERRNLLKKMGVLGLGSVFGVDILDAEINQTTKTIEIDKNKYFYDVDSRFIQYPLTPYQKATTYNNFYEFGMQKDDPFNRARVLKTSPWDVVIDGEVQKPIKISLEDILKRFKLQERIYHFRCVEAWSMNIPWLGFQLGDLIDFVRPKSNAKFVLFETVVQDSMPAVKNPSIAAYIKFPYKEGLRLDEAKNPLTMLTVGMYGKVLPNQNGAPLRLVVPWKYGFKNIKSISRITLVEKMPISTWNKLDSSEYGFYANVNPDVPHPRWSQANERFIGDGFSFNKIATKPFNGYEQEVAKMYAGMDMKKNY